MELQWPWSLHLLRVISRHLYLMLIKTYGVHILASLGRTCCLYLILFLFTALQTVDVLCA